MMILRKKTAFLVGVFVGLAAATLFPSTEEVPAFCYRLLIPPPPTPIELIPVEDLVANCGLLRLRLEEDGSVALNNETLGTISYLGDLRTRIDSIVRERKERRVFIDLDPAQAEFIGAETVKAEFVIVAPDSARYSEVVRLVDLAATFSPSILFIEIDFGRVPWTGTGESMIVGPDDRKGRLFGRP